MSPLSEQESVAQLKKQLPNQVWRHLEDYGLARFPRLQPHPQFHWSAGHVAQVRKLKEFQETKVVKVNPEAAQLAVRQIILEEGKTLLMASPDSAAVSLN